MYSAKIKNKIFVSAILGIFLCSLFFSAQSAQALTVDQIKQKIQDTESQMKILQEKYDKLEEQLAGLKQQLWELENEDEDKEIQTFSINLDKGWNFISFPIKPRNLEVEKVFKSIYGKYTIIQDNGNNNIALKYIPGASNNTLKIIDIYKSYWIKMKSPATLVIRGSVIDIGLKQWLKKAKEALEAKATIGWPFKNSQEIKGFLTKEKMGSDFVIMSATKSYNSSLSIIFSSLRKLEPGKGYAIAKANISKCVDSDNGDDYYTKGSVTYKNRTLTDYCNNKDKVYEYKCVNNKPRSHAYLCPNGCRDGVCIRNNNGGMVEINITYPNGGETLYAGQSYNVKWTAKNISSARKVVYQFVKRNNENYRIKQERNVNIAGADLSKIYYESGALKIPETAEPGEYVFSVEYFDNNGVQIGIDLSGFFTIAKQENNTSECQDSDGGKNYIVKGVVKLGNKKYADFCTQGVYLREYYCKSYDKIGIVNGHCTYGCVEGACRASKPTSIIRPLPEKQETGIFGALKALQAKISKFFQK